MCPTRLWPHFHTPSLSLRVGRHPATSATSFLGVRFAVPLARFWRETSASFRHADETNRHPLSRVEKG